jgi:hypothetical protein
VTFDENDYQQFCQELDALRGRTRPQRVRAGFTERVLESIRHDRAQYSAAHSHHSHRLMLLCLALIVWIGWSLVTHSHPLL